MLPDTSSSQWTSTLTPTCGQVCLMVSTQDPLTLLITSTTSLRPTVKWPMTVNSHLLLFQLNSKPMTTHPWNNNCWLLKKLKLFHSLVIYSMLLLTRLKLTNNSSSKSTTTGTGLNQSKLEDLPTTSSVMLIGGDQSSRDHKKRSSMLTTCNNTQSRSSQEPLAS